METFNENETTTKISEEMNFKTKSYPPRPPHWNNIILLSVFHSLSLILYIRCLLYDVKLKTVLFSIALGGLSGLGMSAGAHRLWAHRSYKARLPFRIWLMILQSMTMNGSIYSYARDHRTHHKASDTERDPKNPSAGFFYAHIGWWLQKKSQTVKDFGSRLDFSDLLQDPVVRFQHRFYVPLFVVLGILIPWLVPVYFWNEDPIISFGTVIIRIIVVLHHLFAVNSFAHFIGHRPYDFRIWPADHRLTNYLSLGEGQHNYHHVFPYDHRINEQAQWEIFNPVTAYIGLHRLMGQVYDCKIASKAAIEEKMKKFGIKPKRDRQRSLPIRILNAVFDWILGLITATWIVWIGLFFKFATGRKIFVF